MFVTPDPATHAALREAVDASRRRADRGAAALPGPRSPLTRDRARRRGRARIDPLPEDGAPLEHVLDDLAPVLDGGIRLGDPYCVAHLHPAPLIAAAAARARGRHDEPVDGRVRRLAGGDVRRGRARRAARAAARARRAARA